MEPLKLICREEKGNGKGRHGKKRKRRKLIRTVSKKEKVKEGKVVFETRDKNGTPEIVW